MANTISAKEIKRRGISAVDEALREGPVYVIQHNRARYVILSEDDYQKLAAGKDASARLWSRLVEGHDPASPGRSRAAIDRDLARERADWDQ